LFPFKIQKQWGILDQYGMILTEHMNLITILKHSSDGLAGVFYFMTSRVPALLQWGNMTHVYIYQSFLPKSLSQA
jgi:hypothetical protein